MLAVAVEKRYAQALFDIAVNNNDSENFEKQLAEVNNLYNISEELKTVMRHPKFNIKERKEVLNNILKDMTINVNTEMKNFLFLLIDKRRIEFINGIYIEFCNLKRMAENSINIEVKSAKSLDNKQLEKIKEKYKRLYNSDNITVNLEIDKSLLGGVKIIVGDKCYDDTVKRKLERLKELLVSD